MKTTIYIIGLALGLALGGAAHATGGGNDGCKPKNGGGYSCDVGGTNYNVANATSEAAALAAAIQFQAQQQAQNQSQVSTNTNTATGGAVNFEGGDTYIAPAPAASADGWCYTTYVGGVCSPLKSRMIEKRQDLIDRCFAKRGDTMAYKACISNIDDSVQIKRALRDAGVYGGN